MTPDIHYLEKLKSEVLFGLTTLESQEVQEKIHQVLSLRSDLSIQEKISWNELLNNHILKYDIIQPLLEDESISEIMINGLNPIFIERFGKLEITPIQFASRQQLENLIQKIATEVGREVNFSKPTMDARLKDGSRVNVILAPIAVSGPVVTIRKFLCAYNTPHDLIQSQMITSTLNAFFKTCFESRFNIFVAGGTGSGKTTFLNCMSNFIPTDERVIVIEDASEIKIQHIPNLVCLETRQGNTQSPVNMSDLIKNALRMRPDRIIVGEVRAAEVIDMLQAMNTGHDGSISTGHSNSALDMLIRLEVIGCTYSDLAPELIKKQIISAIDLIVYIERRKNGKRRVSYVGEINKESKDYCLNKIYDAREDVETSYERLLNRLQYKSKLRYTNEN